MLRNIILVLCVLAVCTMLAAGEWRSVGPDGGYIQAMAIDPRSPERVYCAPYEYPDSARLFMSTDAGASWDEQGRLPDQSVAYLAVDPHSHARLYAGGRANSVYRSTDRGRSWSAVATPGYGTAFCADPLVEGRMMIAGYYQYGGGYRAAAYVSTDTGLTWQVSMPQPDTAGYAYSVAADPLNAGTFYLGAYPGKVFRTTDAGGAWQVINSGLPANTGVMGLSVCGADSRCLLAATSYGMYRTTDAGSNWTRVGAMSSVQSAAFSEADPAVAWTVGRADSIRVFVSTDTGRTWLQPVPGYVTNKTASLVPDPGRGATAWVSTMTGIYRSTDHGSNWHEAHAGLRIGHVPCISASPQDPRRLYLEADGNGVFRSWSGGDSWTRCSDFLECGNICAIGVAAAAFRDVLYALEGSG